MCLVPDYYGSSADSTSGLGNVDYNSSTVARLSMRNVLGFV